MPMRERTWAEMAASTEPSDPRLKPLADRWRNLVQASTGGDPGVARGVSRRYQGRAGRDRRTT